MSDWKALGLFMLLTALTFAAVLFLAGELRPGSGQAAYFFVGLWLLLGAGSVIWLRLGRS